MDLGKFWEHVAAIYMMTKGYSVTARRWKKYGAECDLIMTNQSTMVFIEVKYRKSKIDAASAWSMKQRMNMMKVLEVWAAEAQGKEFRVNYICFWPWGMNHIELDWQDFSRANKI